MSRKLLSNPYLAALLLWVILTTTTAEANPGLMFCRGVAVSTLTSVENFTGLPIKARLRRYIDTLNALAFDVNYEHHVFQGQFMDTPIQFKIGRRLGQGWWGNVHAIEILSYSHLLEEKAPELFHEGQLISLVAKLPRMESISLRKMRRDSVLADYDTERVVKQAFLDIGTEPPSSPRVYSVTQTKESMILKPEIVNGISAEHVIAKFGRLTATQERALKADIYDKSRLIFEKTGIALDIQPFNLVWYTKTKKWGLYELGIASTSVWLGEKFDDYMNIFYQNLQ